MLNGSKYINEKRRDFSLYVLQMRAIPSACDGLKPSSRRVLWTARNGEKIKSASLAGATMPIHPHAAPEGVINTLAGTYNNNIPLLTGYGAFGTLLYPDAYGASRYTSVKVSDFTKDVVFKDIEIIPMVENYDSTLMEPKHFLPLIPIALLNPNEGIAVGFSTNILPRSLQSIVSSQMAFLKNNKIEDIDLSHFPYFKPIDNIAKIKQETETGNRWTFYGEFKKLDSYIIQITKLPYGISYTSFINQLNKLMETGYFSDYDDYSKDIIDIRVKFKRGVLSNITDEELFKKLGLISCQSELMNVLDFDFQNVMNTNFYDYIKKFTSWRLNWYINRYERLLSLIQQDIKKYQDILICIDKKVATIAPKLNDKEELIELLKGFKIHNLEYIANLPIFRLTEKEKNKVQKSLNDALAEEQQYNTILSSEKIRKQIYIDELKDIMKKYGG